MAQVKLLKIVAGFPQEHDSTADDLTVLSLNAGNIQASGNAIISTDGAGALALTPDTTGDLVLDGVNWPQADGTVNQFLQTDGAGQTSWQDGSAANLDLSYTTDGVGVTIRDAVYISAADVVTITDANVLATSHVIGFATSTVGAASPVTVRKGGTLGGFTGLTAGAVQFLSETPGLITPTAPTTAGAVVKQVGFAKNTTTLDIQYDFVGVRA